MNALLRKIITISFPLLFVQCLCIYAQGSKEKAYISRPSFTLDGIKPEASWIWDNGNPNPADYHLLIRKVVTLDENPVKASVYISAYAFADVYINGTLLDRCPVNCDPEYQVYENYDIAKMLKRGENVISAVVYNYGIGMHHRINAQGGFFFQGEISIANKRAIKILSDNSWRVIKAAAWESSGRLRTGDGEYRPNLIGFNELYDASLMPEGWQKAGYDDSKWETAHEIGIPPLAPWNNIVVVKRPPLFRTEVLPVKQWKTKDAMVYDFGKEITGYPQIEINSSKKGIPLEIATGERINSDSSVFATKRVDYTDKYIAKEGIQSWSPATWRGFRYFSIQTNKDAAILKISAQTRNYDLSGEGSFECSDTLLNKIWETGRYTVKLCSQDTYMDTPWREQTQYIAGDSRFLLKYAFYAFGGSSNFLTKYNIISGAESQRWSSEGAIRSRYPTDWLLGKNTSAYLPDYELEWIIMLGEYCRYFGDEDLVKQVYPNMVKLLEYLGKFVSDGHGLMKDAPGWIVLDHPDTYPMDLKSEITALNCLYYEALNQAAFLAERVMHNKSQMQNWQNNAGQLKKNIQTWLWDPEKKLYRDSYGSDSISQPTQVYALLYGLVDEASKESVIKYITDKGRNSEQSFAYYVLYSVFDKNAQWALDYIRSNWGGQMKSPIFNGAWHEGWDVASWTSDVGSTSHAWCSGPTALLPQKVLGAEPLEPGWSSFTVKPYTGNLEWAKGIVPSPKGNINIDWKREGKKFVINITVPQNSKALVNISESEIEYIEKNGIRLSEKEGVNLLQKKNEERVLVMIPGSYSIVCSNK
jgi:hypothetical protein